MSNKFPRLYCFRHLGDCLHGLFFMDRKRESPRCHHIPLEPVLAAMRIAELHGIRKVRITAEVGAGGNLVKPSLVQPLVRFDIKGPLTVGIGFGAAARNRQMYVAKNDVARTKPRYAGYGRGNAAIGRSTHVLDDDVPKAVLPLPSLFA